MKNDEYEALIKDTEVLLSRLHALYEQWFQGIERVEPRLMKREAQRRLDLLRRNQPRNTALRFRAQQVLQRYTTLNHHWTKIARQIEEGTYKRDVMRANRLLKKPVAPPSDGFAKTADMDADALDAHPERFDLGLDLDLGTDEELEAMLAGLEAPKTPTASKPVGPSVPAEVSASAPTSAPAAQVPAPAKPAAPTPPAVAKPGPPPPPPSGLLRVPGPAAASSAARPAPPPPPPSGLIRPPQAAGGPPSPRAAAGAPPPPPSGLLRAPPPPPPAAAAKPVPPAAGVVSPPRPAAAAPAASSSATSAAVSKSPGRDSGLDDARMRAIYDRYVDARRQNNERVDNVKFETVASSIEKMMPGLAEKHRGKSIDFEVVVKDGRVGLKPVAK